MKKILEDAFGMPFEKLLQSREEFTLQEALSSELPVRALVYFNLAKDCWKEDEPGYSEAKRDETAYLTGNWFYQ